MDIEQLYTEKRDDYVRMYLSRAGGNDVEDLVQEAFYRALYYEDSYKPDLVSIDVWFGGIMENCLKDLYREKRDGASMHDKLTEESAIISPMFDEGFTKVLLTEIGKKKGDHSNILYLYFICGYELKEIQQVVGGSYATINQSVGRFKSLLRDTYPEYMPENMEG